MRLTRIVQQLCGKEPDPIHIGNLLNIVSQLRQHKPAARRNDPLSMDDFYHIRDQFFAIHPERDPQMAVFPDDNAETA